MTVDHKPAVSREVLIAGAGPAGLALSLALARAGFDVAISDGRALETDGAPGARGGEAGAVSKVYLVAAGCWRIFEALGVADELTPFAEPVREVGAAAGSDAAVFHDYDADDEGSLGFVIESRALESVLAAAVTKEPAIDVRALDRLVGLEIGAGAVLGSFESGEDVSARLVVGCDGARSLVRSSAGIAFEGWDYAYRAVSTIMISDVAHGGRARQEFLPGGPIAALPMTEGRVNVVWSVKAAVAETLTAMSDEDFEAELARLAPGFLPGARLAGARGSFPLANRIAASFHGERVALAGDSAHLVHPLAGQGLNLGLKDVAALVDVVSDAARVGLDIGSEVALAPYTQWRRADVVATAAAMEGFHRAFTAPGPVRGLAGLAMKAAASLKPARRLFAREAAGVSGDAPSLMRQS